MKAKNRASSSEPTYSALRQREQSGVSMVELCLGLVIIVMVVSVLMGNMATTYVSIRTHKDKVFAYTTAQGILAELSAQAESVTDGDIFDVDSFDDGASSVATLSVVTEAGALIAPDHPISRNIARQGKWIWVRRIKVSPLPGIDNRNLRYVTVTIYRNKDVEEEYASLSTVMNTTSLGYPTTQVFDTYMLAVENVPGWWVNMESTRSFIESTLTDLEGRNPGLEFRSHWITKSSYGRNKVYRPYINVGVDSLAEIPLSYYYPGLLPSGGAITNYYSPDIIQGRMMTEGGGVHGYDSVSNPFPYALADAFNHGMRYPEERDFHARRVAEIIKKREAIDDAKLKGLVVPAEMEDMSEEPTLRLFLEDLNTNPGRYQNAIVMNLHGELLPVPPIRNFSDAAKTPTALPFVRVVSHSEQLRTERPVALLPGEDVELRVYAYTSDPDLHVAYMAGKFPGQPLSIPRVNPISVRIPGVNIIDAGAPGGLFAGVQIEHLAGGVDDGSGDSDYKPFAPSQVFGSVGLAVNEMCYLARWVDPGPGLEKYTELLLFHTPLVTPLLPDTLDPTKFRGLRNDAQSRLYGLEYIPGSTEAAHDFSRDLYTAGNGPKNSARWKITIPKSVLSAKRFVVPNTLPGAPNATMADGATYDPVGDVELKFETRIWNPLLNPDEDLAGTMWPKAIDPENLSVTYTWWADSPDDVPATERSQFLGDPRHNPYRDVYKPVPGYLPDFPNGYNWFHDDLEDSGDDATNDYPGIDSLRLNSAWEGRVRCDIPRLFSLYRDGLVKNGCVFTALNGWSFYYIGLGGEIGSDSANGYPDSIPVNRRPYGQPGVSGFVNNIIFMEGGANVGGRRFMRGNGVLAHWWGMPWLGEHYPDSLHGAWTWVDAEGKLMGNVLAGNTSANEIYRSPEPDVYAGSKFAAYGTDLLRSEHRTKQEGCTAWFNIGTTLNTFHHQSRNGKFGDLVGGGLEIGNNYNLELPATTEIGRPFALSTDTTGGPGSQFNFEPYLSQRCSGSMLRTYYNHEDGNTGSGLVRWTDNSNSSSAFVMVNGLSASLLLGTADIAKYAVLGTIHSFFEAGGAAVPHRIVMPPRVSLVFPTEITELNNPVTISVQWDIEWKRWDGMKYTGGMAGGFTEVESDVSYVLMYSKDLGKSWFYVDDNTVARPGTGAEDPTHMVADATVGTETFVWNVPAASFPQQFYLLRVEAYRTGQPLHYSHHQTRVFIDR